MIIYEGKYSWSGKKNSDIPPINWWAGAYRLKIIDLSKNNPDVVMLKPIAVIVSDTGEGSSATNYAPELVKNVCRDFHLEISKIIWIEYHPGPPPHMEVARFKTVTKISDETLYSASWRPIWKEELNLIAPFSTEAQEIIRRHQSSP